MSAEILQELITCERHISLFPSGMPLRACLRRQMERQRGVKAGELGPPTKPFYAREVAEIAAEASRVEAA